MGCQWDNIDSKWQQYITTVENIKSTANDVFLKGPDLSLIPPRSWAFNPKVRFRSTISFCLTAKWNIWKNTNLALRLHDSSGAIESPQRQWDRPDRLNFALFVETSNDISWITQNYATLPITIYNDDEPDRSPKLCSETFLARQGHAWDTCALK